MAMTTLHQLTSGKLIGATKIKLTRCGLSKFPVALLEHADTLEFLDLSGNNLSTLPEEFERFTRLKVAFFSDNAFTTFPSVVGRCKALEMVAFKGNGMIQIPDDAFPSQLRWLILTNNRISALPRSIGRCDRLEKAMLAGNCLESLPKEMAKCKNLGLLRISSNNIQEIPEWLPRMPKLSWLAFSSNPCLPSTILAEHHVLPDVPWDDLVLYEKLGEGASGTIYKAVRKDTNESVAVKLFKGEVTSDGLPSDEMDACILAGRHPHLIDPIGRVIDHPQKIRGLVLELIPPSYKVLGGPPNFDTCTRDTFTTNTNLALSSVLDMAYGIASVAAHLHSQGISHSDLYCHNVLWNPQTSYSLLGDFGAATLYSVDHPLAPLFHRLEVSAFGKLLDDLVRHCRDSDEFDVLDRLDQLQADCLQLNVMARPSFVHICETLKHLHSSAGVQMDSVVLGCLIKVA